MALIVNGKINNAEPAKVETKPQPAPQPVRAPISKTAETTPTPTGHTMVVNGKEIKIGKKSPYLLDMFTIDDDI